jgi:hypothetical protein
MLSFGMSRRVTLVKTEVSEGGIASIIREKRITELGTLAKRSNLRSVLQLLVTAKGFPCVLILFTMTLEAIRSSETSILTKATLRSIPEDDIRHSHRRENLKSYIA